MKTLTQQNLESRTIKNVHNSTTLISLKSREGILQFTDFKQFRNSYNLINSLPPSEIVQRYYQLGFESLIMRYSKVCRAESNFADSLSSGKWEEINTAPPELIYRLQHSTLFNNNFAIIKINRFKDGYNYYELNSPNEGLANLLSSEAMINIGGTLLKITQQEIENVSRGTILTKDDFIQLNNDLNQAGPKDTLVHFKRSRLVNLGQFYNFYVIPEYNHLIDVFEPGSSEMIALANVIWHIDPLKGSGISGVSIDFGPPGSNKATSSFSKGGEADDERLKVLGYLDFVQNETSDSTPMNQKVEVSMVAKGLALKKRLWGLWYDSANSADIVLSGQCHGNSVQGHIPGQQNNITANFTFGINEQVQNSQYIRTLPTSIHPNVIQNTGNPYKRFNVYGDVVILAGNSYIKFYAKWKTFEAEVNLQF